MSSVIPWITTIVGVVGVGAALWRIHVERQRNKVLQRQLELSERRPELQILELKATGGGTFVDFTAYAQNVGTKSVRPVIAASVGEHPVQVSAEVPDFLPDAPATRILISVPRPQLGDLMKECDDATTLYGETLHVILTARDQPVEKTWREEIYDSVTDRARHEVQQRYWRRGRGEETEADRLGEEQWRVVHEYERGETAATTIPAAT